MSKEKDQHISVFVRIK